MGASKRNTLLLIERDQTRRLRLGTAILREGWQLAMLERGAEALQVASYIKPSVILCDLDDQANLRHIEALRANGCADATIIGLVSHNSVDNPGTVDGLITRPVKPPALFEMIADCEKRHTTAE
jgi:ActR/RegA family two-component response regulator